jgi:hypothetical protein
MAAATTMVTDVRDLFMATEKKRAAQGQTRVAPVSEYREQPTALTFGAFVIDRAEQRSAKGSAYTRVTYTPYGLASLVPRQVEVVDGGGAKAMCDLFTFATADRRAIWVHVYEETLQKGGPGRAAVKERRRCEEGQSVLLAEGAVYYVNVFRGTLPQPGTFAKVYNAVASIYNGRVSLSEVQAFDRCPYEGAGGENELPLSERLLTAFPDARQRLPALLPLLPLPESVRWQVPECVVRVRVACDRCAEGADAGDDSMWHLPLAVPQPQRRVAPGDMVTDVTYLARPSSFMHAGQATGSGDALLDRTEFRFSLRVRQLEVGAPDTARFALFKVITLYGEQCVGLGVRHPRVVQALLVHHAVPFQLVFAPRVDESLADSANADPSGKLRAGYEDGVYKGNVLFVHWDLAAYLVEHGLSVSRAVVTKRFGGPFIQQPYNKEDLDAHCAPRKVTSRTTGKTFDRPELKNPMAEVLPLHASGIVALDEARGIAVPEETEFCFYALPLGDVAEARAARDRADEYVLSKEGKSKAAAGDVHANWMQPPSDTAFDKRRVPKFLFYAVKNEVVGDIRARLAVTAADADTAPPATDDGDGKPRHLEALRMQIVADAERRLSATAPPTGEPEAKRARIGEASPSPPASPLPTTDDAGDAQ